MKARSPGFLVSFFFLFPFLPLLSPLPCPRSSLFSLALPSSTQIPATRFFEKASWTYGQIDGPSYREDLFLIISASSSCSPKNSDFTLQFSMWFLDSSQVGSRRRGRRHRLEHDHLAPSIATSSRHRQGNGRTVWKTLERPLHGHDQTRLQSQRWKDTDYW